MHEAEVPCWRRMCGCSCHSRTAAEAIHGRGRRRAGAPVRSRSAVAEASAEPLGHRRAIGVAVDGKDNVWIIHRAGSLEAKEKYATWNPRASECCVPAPAVLQFNQAGDLIGSWGGPGQGYDWPSSNHGIDVDYKGNVWIGGNGRGQQPAALAADESKMAAAGAVHDSMLLKFTQSGKFLMQIGKPNQSKGSNDTDNLRLPAKSLVDPKTNELYVADGYGNRRVIVYDADTGKYKRHWGAYGNKPDDTELPPYNPSDPPSKQFRTPVHGVALANDGLLYVCDRTNDRIQVFKTDGTYVKEQFIAKDTLGDGSAFDVALSRDPQQKYLVRRRRLQHEGSRAPARHAGDSDDLRRWWSPARRVLCGPQHCHRLQRKHLHHGNISRAACAEVPFPWPRARYQEGPGCRVAEV